MSNMRVTDVDGLAVGIGKVLSEFEGATFDDVKEAVDETAKECRKDIQANITSAGIGGTGEYRKSWKVKKVTAKNKWGYAKAVYSELPHLPHLLEHGHAKRGGGRVEGKPHIAPAEAKAEQRFVELLRQKIGGR